MNFLRRRWRIVLLLLLSGSGWFGINAQEAPDPLKAPWGRLLGGPKGAGTWRLEVSVWPSDGKLVMPGSFPDITAARLVFGGRGKSLGWGLEPDAKLYLELPARPPEPPPAMIEIELATNTAQFAGGRITFHPAEAELHGPAKLNGPSGGSQDLSLEAAGAESLWNFKPTRWGAYDVEVSFSAANRDGLGMRVEIAGQIFTLPPGAASLKAGQTYTTINLGRLHLSKSDPFSAKVSLSSVKDGASFRLRALTLRPAPEDGPVTQGDDGIITLRSGQATTHSVMMRYEPATIKNCLGYWVNPSDWADWQFSVARPGTYEVEVWQGCGKGQGGSDVAVEVAGRRFDFVVEETGHFQIFLPRKLGRVTFSSAGGYTLAIKPQRKQAGAVMDIRQFRLLPVDSARGAAVPQFPGKQSLWFGFNRHDFVVDGRPVLVVAPKIEAPGRPWAWHGEFFGHKPDPDIALLGRGFHIVYMSVPDMLGCPEAVGHWSVLYAELTGKYGFAKKPALVGLSRGGLYVYNWAVANPDKVACLYGDAPVCDLRSWPGGKGKGPGSPGDWKLAFERYGFKSEEEAVNYPGNPVDNLAPLAAARVPLLHVYGDADEVVPWDENTGVVAERYRKLGGTITLIAKPGGKHHPHSLEDPTPIVNFLWENAANEEARAWLAAHGGGPLDSDSRPLIRRAGTIDLDLVETTPVVFNGKLWRFEWVREGYWNNQRKTNYFRLVDHETGEATAPFADGHEFGSAFVDDGTVYVTGALGRSRVDMFASRDLKTWETWPVIDDPRYGIFNTSLCRAGGEFVLMFEIDRPAGEAGIPFTARFAKSPDLRKWTLTPPECNYAKDRYTAPHCLRWLDGWFYDFYLEARDGYEMRVVRSRDLVKWESSPLNPVLRSAPEDRLIANPKLTESQRSRIANAVNRNNSDIDFCEWHGRLVLNYSWGNQSGVEHLAEGYYDGSMARFVRSWFPGQN